MIVTRYILMAVGTIMTIIATWLIYKATPPLPEFTMIIDGGQDTLPGPDYDGIKKNRMTKQGIILTTLGTTLQLISGFL